MFLILWVESVWLALIFAFKKRYAGGNAMEMICFLPELFNESHGGYYLCI